MQTVEHKPDYQTLAKMYVDPSLEGVTISHLSFEQLCKGCEDLRTLIKELRDFPTPINPKDVVIDSDMKLHEAFRCVSPDCPAEIIAQQQLIRVFYFGSDGKLHHGQVVIHQALVEDVIAAYNVLLKEGIPVESAIPVAHPKFEREGKWDDNLSMELNNSSAFNYRRMLTASGEQKRLSLHGLGMALDINPVQNPCYYGPAVHKIGVYSAEAAAGYQVFVPANAKYDLSDTRSFHNRHPLVLELEKRGWTWGGVWGAPKDLHHFQKIPAGLEERVSQLRAPSVTSS